MKIKAWALFSGLLLTAFPVVGKQIALYHTSDAHGFYYPRNGVGGYAALKSVLDAEKRPFFLFDSGDYCNGTAAAKHFQCNSSVTLMHSLGISAATSGNHEWDFGEDHFFKLAQNSGFPILEASLTDVRTKKPLPYVKPYVILEKDGVKTAVIGIGLPNADSKRLKAKNPLKVLKKLMPEIKKHSPGLIILLIHGSAEEVRGPLVSNRVIAREVPEINIILGGHAHYTDHSLEGETLLVESGANLQTVSQIIVEIDDETGRYSGASSRLITLDASVEDSEVKKLAESFKIPGLDDVIGNISEPISRTPVGNGCLDVPLSNWAADIYAQNAVADIYVHNTFGTRFSLPAGPFTTGDMNGFYPFKNTLVLVEVDGKFVRDLFRSTFYKEQVYFGFHGLTADFEIKNGKIKKENIAVNGRPLDLKAKYIIAVNDYLANGNQEGKLFKKISKDKKTFTGLSINEMLINEIRSPALPNSSSADCRLRIR